MNTFCNFFPFSFLFHFARLRLESTEKIEEADAHDCLATPTAAEHTQEKSESESTIVEHSTSR